MRISDAAKSTGLSVSNIRFYERKGLLSPAREQESKYRDYTQEDLDRLKQIILYRKMNISVETIFLLQKGEISVETVLRRQYNELIEQRDMLQGSIDLCSRILKEPDPSQIDVDSYLSYVKTEEDRGTKFAELNELLEDVADFSGLTPFRSDPYVGHFLQWHGTMPILSVLLIAIWIGLPIVMTAERLYNHETISPALIAFWVVWLYGIGLAFYRFRKSRKENE